MGRIRDFFRGPVGPVGRTGATGEVKMPDEPHWRAQLQPPRPDQIKFDDGGAGGMRHAGVGGWGYSGGPSTVVIQGGPPGENGRGGRGGSFTLVSAPGGVSITAVGGESGDGVPGETRTVFMPVRNPRLDGTDRFGFGAALDLLETGGRVSRFGWNGKGMYLELQWPDEHSKMTQPYLWMWTADRQRVPWFASQTDLLARDWMRVGVALTAESFRPGEDVRLVKAGETYAHFLGWDGVVQRGEPGATNVCIRVFREGAANNGALLSVPPENLQKLPKPAPRPNEA